MCVIHIPSPSPSPLHVASRTNHTLLSNQAGHTPEHHESEHERDAITTEVIATLNTLSQTTITAYSDQERHVPIKRDAHHFGFDADSSSEMNTDSSFDSNRTEHKSKTAPVPFERKRLKERIERIKSAPSSSAHPFPLCFAANSHFSISL